VLGLQARHSLAGAHGQGRLAQRRLRGIHGVNHLLQVGHLGVLVRDCVAVQLSAAVQARAKARGGSHGGQHVVQEAKGRLGQQLFRDLGRGDERSVLCHGALAERLKGGGHRGPCR
jgi:hypothetical protein